MLPGLIYIKVYICFNIFGCIRPLQTVLDMNEQDGYMANRDLHYFKIRLFWYLNLTTQRFSFVYNVLSSLISRNITTPDYSCAVIVGYICIAHPEL